MSATQTEYTDWTSLLRALGRTFLELAEAHIPVKGARKKLLPIRYEREEKSGERHGRASDE